MPYCLRLGINTPSLWRASTSALVKKINDLCFALPTQRLISDEIDPPNDDDSTPNSIYIKSLLTCAEQQTNLVDLIDSISIYFETIEKKSDLACQFSTGDTRDLLRSIIFMCELIYIYLVHQKSFLSWTFVSSFFRCLTKTIYQTNSLIYQSLTGTDQIISCCMLAKSLRAIFMTFNRQHAIVASSKRTNNRIEVYMNLIESDSRPLCHVLIRTFDDIDHLYHLIRQIRTMPIFYRHQLRTMAILIFRLPVFNSFIRIPVQYWEQQHETRKLQFSSQTYCLSPFPLELLQHSDVMSDYVERISLVGWLSRTQFQEIWVTFLAAINPTNSLTIDNDNEHSSTNVTREEILETNATQW
jgi:hypothetical protein